MDPLGGGATKPQAKGPGVVAGIDFGLYRFEKGLAWVALLTMAVSYFLAIFERELTAGPGQNALERFIMKRLGETTQSIDPALLDQIHTVWSPVFAGLIAFLLILVGVFTVRTGDSRPSAGTRARWFGMGIGAAGLFGAAVVFAPSTWLCGGLFGAGVIAGFASIEADKRPRAAMVWALPIIAGLWFIFTRIESGYSWSKDLSMVLLMWVGFIGASMATYENRNIQVDFVRKNVPRYWLRQYEVVGSLLTAGFTGLLAALAYDTVSAGVGNAVLLPNIQIPDYLVPMPLFIGFVIIGGRYLLQAFRLAMGTERPAGEDQAPDNPRIFFIASAILLALAVAAIVGIGPRGGGLIACVLLLLLLGAPLFVVIGGLALGCFAFWPQVIGYFDSFEAFTLNFNLMARMRDLADQESLVAIPFFMIAGAIMSRGAIARQLVECARAAFGWLPGGLAISTVIACMFFAAISGSSPVTVITIGAIMYPALLDAGYPEKFSMGLVTSAGSLGIIIPPSIPMIVYAIFATMNGTPVDIKDLFIAGVGPGLVIGGSLAAVCVYKGARIPREQFEWARLFRSVREGFWALFLPGFILIGIYFGIFNAIEASAIAVILALVIELFVHRELSLGELPAVLADSAALMGSILVIISVALGLSEFMTINEIPDAVVGWLASYELTPLGFVLLLNVMLIIVGCLMDIISALILFVPLIIPLAAQLGIDPIHLGLIFIVNLEIGYLTPPLGLNLFVSSGFFQKPFGDVMKSVLPFIGALVVSLAIITSMPTISLGLVRLMHNADNDCDREELVLEAALVFGSSEAFIRKCRPVIVPFPSGKTLKPSDNKGDSGPTGFVEATRATNRRSTSPTASLKAVTNRSRVSEVEPTGELIDFDTFGVRAIPEMVDGKHATTVVVLSSMGENCEEAGAEPEDEEWVLRISIPAGTAAETVFDLAAGEAEAALVWYEEGKETRRQKADSGVVLVIEAELAGTPSSEDAGLFGAFELKFGEDALNGKFVPLPCESGAPVYK
ncbi:MAG: C4-dicarboxylate transporter DctM subunit [Myxococcota bacterium]|jgi:C4-dicarboxylate transporter DctM subunit